MIQPKYILIPAITSGLLLLAGCSHTIMTTNVVNETANANAAVEVAVDTNTNATVVDENDNAADASEEEEVDTSDWLTYTNEEYGFSFRYPEGWALVDADNQPSNNLGLENTESIAFLKQNTGGQLLGIYVVKLSFKEARDGIDQFDPVISPVLSEEEIMLDEVEATHIVKETAIAGPDHTYIIALNDSTTLIVSGFQIYGSVIRELKLK